jgi:uracil-DNA glycosylase
MEQRLDSSTGQPNSRLNKGWEDFTDAAVEVMNRQRQRQFLSWGYAARNMASRPAD